MHKSEWQVLADVRIDEAQTLLVHATPLPDGAYYLAGYAVECALKAVVMKRFFAEHLPEKKLVLGCYTHDLDELITLANLRGILQSICNANPIFADNWATVSNWSEQSRYTRNSFQKAQRLIQAINDSQNGVIPWIKTHW